MYLYTSLHHPPLHIFTFSNKLQFKCITLSPVAVPKPKLKDLIRLEISNWYSVGLQLDLDDEDLDGIEQTNPDLNTRKRKMFSLWLRLEERPSYHTLARALFLADENNAANGICTTYGETHDMSHEYQYAAIDPNIE